MHRFQPRMFQPEHPRLKSVYVNLCEDVVVFPTGSNFGDWMVQSQTSRLRGGGCSGSITTCVDAIDISNFCHLEEEVFLTVFFTVHELSELRAVLIYLTLVNTIPGRSSLFLNNFCCFILCRFLLQGKLHQVQGDNYRGQLTSALQVPVLFHWL